MVTVPLPGPCSATASHRRLGLTARQLVPLLSAANMMNRCKAPLLHLDYFKQQLDSLLKSEQACHAIAGKHELHLSARLHGVQDNAVAGHKQHDTVVQHVHAIPDVDAQSEDMPATYNQCY